MGFLCCIVIITYIQSTTTLPKHISNSHDHKDSHEEEHIKEDTHLESVVKTLYNSLKTDILNENFLDRLVEKLTLIQPKPLVKVNERYANGSIKINEPSRRSELLDKARYAVKSLSVYEKFIGENLDSDYKTLAHVLFGVNTKQPGLDNYSTKTTTEEYKEVESESNKTKANGIKQERKDEKITSAININEETKTTKPKSIMMQGPHENRRFEITNQTNSLKHSNDPVNNIQDSIIPLVNNDTVYNLNRDAKNEDEFNRNNESPTDQNCKKYMINSRRSENNQEKDIVIVIPNDREKNQTNITVVPPPPLIRLLKKAWGQVMEYYAKRVNDKALSDKKTTISTITVDKNNIQEITQVSDNKELIHKVKDIAMKQNRRTLSEGDDIDDDDENDKSKVNNPWCSTELLCRKTGVPICGMDIRIGHARFEDICHLLLVNCYYRLEFIPEESCVP